MALNLNTIGNYSPLSVRTNHQNSSPKTLNGSAGTDKISNDEKEYFADMYPSSKTEIMDYSFYGRTGKMNGVSIGINIDRRG